MIECQRAVLASIAVVLIMGSCTREDDATKKEAERLRAEVAAMKAENANKEASKARAEADRLKAELAAAKASKAPSSAGPLRGQKVIDEFRKLGEGQELLWKMPAGRYRVRATASDKGLKIKWVGADCASSPKEVKVYDDTCEVSSEAQLIVENPTGFGFGPSEQVSVTVTSM